MVNHTFARAALLGGTLLLLPFMGRAAGVPAAAERGRNALLSKAYVPPTITRQAYESAWSFWGVEKKPAAGDYDRLFRERYGMHPAPYPNGRYPMGLQEADGNFGFVRSKGVTITCLVCHGGSIFGQSYIGLGNTALDFELFHEETSGVAGRRAHPPFHFTNVRGTVEAGPMAVFLLGYREPDLRLRFTRLELDLRDDTCEDVPAWWLLKKKKSMYHTGGVDTRSVRSLMQFMMSPLNFPSAFHRAESDFADIRAYLLTLEAPKYPLAIDRKLAARGEAVFRDRCARCHGSYGEKWTYPNRVVPLAEIGTDPRRYEGITQKFVDYYNRSWFGETLPAWPSEGYQAPPLDGVWATAPYLHNGSVPTLYNLLNSKTRPKVFTRSFRTGRADYDEQRVGWKVRVLDSAPDASALAPGEARKVYDTRMPGRGNGGHTFGDRLTEEERWAVIEYLKTL